ncbi:unnamed protein product [Blepharisma stoltei]|uniref:PPM-type phosphatase domain-containing protein n=1 Tax=Blepharisma stoltei TaxID=1481888 RepID=A0AAU9JCG5_9CILI|nr:unnamed protein product [Blepharisma stoltei]
MNRSFIRIAPSPIAKETRHNKSKSYMTHELVPIETPKISNIPIIRKNQIREKSKTPSSMDLNSIYTSNLMIKKEIPFIIRRKKNIVFNFKSVSKKLNLKQLNKTYDQPQCPYVSFSVKSQIGMISNKPKPNNQDSYFTISEFAKSKFKAFFGVCDGHGLYGHLVSDEIKFALPKLLEEKFKTEKEPIDWESALSQSIIRVHETVINKPKLNSDFSGSTLNCILINKDELYCANVGDSRAVLGRKQNEKFVSVPLSKDHKLNDYGERRRIERLGGRVDNVHTPSGISLGPLRVYIGVQNIPGLAMSRSIGDKKASDIGVIPDPEIIKIHLTNDDKFVIIASDGLWDVISSEQAVDICRFSWKSGHIHSASEVLIKEATRKWQEKQQYMDDITVLVIFLKPSWNILEN